MIALLTFIAMCSFRSRRPIDRSSRSGRSGRVALIQRPADGATSDHRAGQAARSLLTRLQIARCRGRRTLMMSEGRADSRRTSKAVETFPGVRRARIELAGSAARYPASRARRGGIPATTTRQLIGAVSFVMCQVGPGH